VRARLMHLFDGKKSDKKHEKRKDRFYERHDASACGHDGTHRKTMVNARARGRRITGHTGRASTMTILHPATHTHGTHAKKKHSKRKNECGYHEAIHIIRILRPPKSVNKCYHFRDGRSIYNNPQVKHGKINITPSSFTSPPYLARSERSHKAS